MTPSQREEIAKILETIARDGLPGPRDLDVALDAIEAAMPTHIGDAAEELHEAAAGKFWMLAYGRIKPGEPLWAAAIMVGDEWDEFTWKGEGTTPSAAVGAALAEMRKAKGGKP